MTIKSLKKTRSESGLGIGWKFTLALGTCFNSGYFGDNIKTMAHQIMASEALRAEHRNSLYARKLITAYFTILAYVGHTSPY